MNEHDEAIIDRQMMDEQLTLLPSADDIVARYIALRDYVKAEDDTHKERMSAYREAMQALEGAADLLMKQTGQRALSTDHGTAYYSHTLSAKCEDPQMFFDFVFQHNAREYLTSHVAKEAVQAYMDGPGAGHPPPGVKTEQVVKVNFRKS